MSTRWQQRGESNVSPSGSVSSSVEVGWGVRGPGAVWEPVRRVFRVRGVETLRGQFGEVVPAPGQIQSEG